MAATGTMALVPAAAPSLPPLPNHAAVHTPSRFQEKLSYDTPTDFAEGFFDSEFLAHPVQVLSPHRLIRVFSYFLLAGSHGCPIPVKFTLHPKLGRAVTVRLLFDSITLGIAKFRASDTHPFVFIEGCAPQPFAAKVKYPVLLQLLDANIVLDSIRVGEFSFNGQVVSPSPTTDLKISFFKPTSSHPVHYNFLLPAHFVPNKSSYLPSPSPSPIPAKAGLVNGAGDTATSTSPNPAFAPASNTSPASSTVPDYVSSAGYITSEGSSTRVVSITSVSNTSSSPTGSDDSDAGERLIRRTMLPSYIANEAIHYTSPRVELTSALKEMEINWTQSELQNGRRLVRFNKVMCQDTLFLSFHPIPQEEFSPSDAVISCICRDNDVHCVTSVDIIVLLEKLSSIPFPVEEKNRIRRNLEGLRPSTISKNDQTHAQFFSFIMDLPEPRPRNIEKDLKVFSWTDLDSALARILCKYVRLPERLEPVYDSYVEEQKVKHKARALAKSSAAQSFKDKRKRYDEFDDPPHDSPPAKKKRCIDSTYDPPSTKRRARVSTYSYPPAPEPKSEDYVPCMTNTDLSDPYSYESTAFLPQSPTPVFVPNTPPSPPNSMWYPNPLDVDSPSSVFAVSSILQPYTDTASVLGLETPFPPDILDECVFDHDSYETLQ